MINKNKTKKKLDATAQKLKGKAQKAVGEFQMQSGETIKGGISKAKGELNERVANAKLKMGNNDNQKVDTDDDLDI